LQFIKRRVGGAQATGEAGKPAALIKVDEVAVQKALSGGGKDMGTSAQAALSSLFRVPYKKKAQGAGACDAFLKPYQRNADPSPGG